MGENLKSALLQRQRRSCRQTDRQGDRQEASRANSSSQYLDRPAQPISSEMGAQQLSIGHWSRLGLAAFPFRRLEETGNRLQEKTGREEVEEGKGVEEWRDERGGCHTKGKR